MHSCDCCPYFVCCCLGFVTCLCADLRAADRRIYEALISLADKRNITVPAGTNKAAAMFNEIATQCTNLRFRPIMFIECKPRSTAPGTTTSMNTCMDRLFGSYLK